ncbi:MAG: LytTR family DNA-binding domain-containing protein [Bacteroidales bacterium]|nr:LytTR family DNA-binding domain-containing protein [Bacteroidales bacterium]NCU36205.1 response regulator transcription factor [Candidatus Falkowbacteria bacterium]MDD2631385.1 LytTR family DNA-binding domain-containing protein [Bacteroidales bacterium]MDD3131410.1 LytTR family DNA-binding domain-containing protein [Bacteroidales bacterium]MDD3527691.1 LytTR family DNA-binding domain-containing protein [Bacteroidales bacterium]
MVKAVIIDDEKKSRQALTGLLERYCHNVIILGEAEGVRSGIEMIKSTSPDVVFLDIQMQDGSGFRLLQSFEKIDFEIVFTTAFDQYAIKAIRFSALDYLLKPIVPQELMEAVRKVEDLKMARQQNIQENINVLLENIQNPAESRKIILSTAEKIHVVDVDDIIRCESDNYYTKFFFLDGSRLLISKTLKENESLLRGHQFIRSHKSHLVNTKYIRGFVKSDGGYILMSDNSKVPVSRRRKELIMETLNNL